MQRKKLPIGIEDFKELRREDFYYIDKTELICDLLRNWGKVNLFTRPRRFGKTLNMSMLKYFFELGTDPALFDGLAVSREKALCEEYLGKYPVIFLSLKGVDGLTYGLAVERFKTILQEEVIRLHAGLDEKLLSPFDRSTLIQMENRILPEEEMLDSLKFLSRVLYTCFNQKVILLIDEYDVPLDKAFHHGYYEEMVSLIRGLFGQALKTNEYLHFAVLTGCLRVSKESIFTGLNNFKILSITDTRFEEQFGFTETEVRQLLMDYGLEDHLSETREWYDGYQFGNANIYCPWDVICYVDHLLADPEAEPETFWINTSGNDLVRRFIDKADKTTQNEIERLIAGETIEKTIRLDLTYNELDASIENLWSVLFTTGYLTRSGRAVQGVYPLLIPNREIREVFILQIQEWFRARVKENVQPVRPFCQAFREGKPEAVQKHLNVILSQMISILDTKAPDAQKENFYHGLLLGLLRSEAEWLILSNAESGDGFSDILIETEDPDEGIVIEVKYAANIAGLEKACGEALTQIKEKRYDERLRNDGRTEIWVYGIAFCKKRCRVAGGKLEKGT